MAAITMKKEGIYTDEFTILNNQVLSMASSMERKNIIVGECLIFAVYEKYYLRSENFTSLSIVLHQVENEVHLHAITAAGGSGIFNISFGAENSFLKDFKELCFSLQFIEYDESNQLNYEHE